MSDITVSIGMIVKNEEKYIGACLDSLKPLMDNVKCELVVVDTGSTDNTVEIVRQYTDKVYFFDWVNDFSAARNHGLLKCVGEWFMYTDADTIFDKSEENMQPLIDFFKNKDLNKDYISATYTTRNYYDPSHTGFSEHKEHRITRRTPGLRFVYPIHETFNCTNDKICFLSTYAHHYGYAFANLAEAGEKSRRNCTLLRKEIEKKPDDIRLRCLLFDSVLDHEEKIRIMEETFKLAQTSDQTYAPVTYVRAVGFYAKFDYEKAAAIAEEYISRIKGDATLIDVYYKLGVIKENLHEFDAALEAFKKCREHQILYNEQKLNMTRLTFITLGHIGAESEADVFRRIVFCMVNVGKTDEAYDFWEDNYSELKKRDAFQILENIILVSKDYSRLGGIYEKLAAEEDGREKAKAFEVFLENQYYKADVKERFAKELSKSQSDFGGLMRLVLLEKSGEFLSEANKFLADFEWREGFAELMYLLIKGGYDIRKTLPSFNFNLTREYIDKMSLNHNDFGELVFNRCRPFDYLGSMMEVLWLTSALEAAIFAKNQKPNEDIRLGIYKDYVEILVVLVSNLYNKELLNDTDAKVLPELHRFGYHMINARDKLEKGDKVGYIRGIKSGLLSCECAKDIAVALTNDFLEQQ